MAVKTKKPKAKAARPKKPLTPAQKHAAQITKDPLYTPGAPLAGTSLEKAANQLTSLEFKPKIAALDSQAKTEKTQGTALIDKTTGYYKDMAAQEAARLARQTALSGELDTRLKAIDTDTTAHLDQPVPKVGSGAPGLSGGADDQFANELAAQRARAASTAAAYRTGGAVESGNWEGYSHAMAGARAFHGDEAHTDLTTRLANRLSSIGQEKKALQATKGDQTVKNLLDLRKSSFEDIATLQGLGLKKSQIDASLKIAQGNNAASLAAASTRANATTTAAQIRADATLAAARARSAKGQKLTPSQKLALRRDRAQRRNHTGPYAPGGPKASKPSQSSFKAHGLLDNFRSSIRRYRGAGLSGPQITKKARKSKAYDDVIFNAARDLEYRGFISAPNLAALHRRGVKIDKHGN
jgi:hypothetical protein